MLSRLTVLVMIVLTLPIATAFADDLSKDIPAAEAGDFDAMLRVGLAYLSDEDEANNQDGIKWLEMSSAGGNVVAYFNLGAMYQDGKAIKQDSQKAIMYLTIAAELGEVRAMNRLAGIYYLGKLAPANDILAVKWGLCAVALGNEAAKANVDKMRAEVGEREAQLGAKAALAWTKRRLAKTAK
jgi:TPR repeat protein